MKKAHYIASTHWDREWYESFQGFRFRLVTLIDEVLDHLDKDPGFSSFEMDAQVVPVLDYLEVRQDEIGRINRLSKAGRFRIGPWYVLPDEWLVSGESLIRNLELGLETTRKHGSPRPLSAPLIDEFGHVSQIPQICTQFGFVGTFLHRGLNLTDCQTNFNWLAPDGSSIICHRLPKHGYGTFQIFYRRVLELDESFDFDKTVDRFVEWTLLEAERTKAGPILLLDSCDHVEIEPRASKILDAANRKLKAHGILVVHSNSDVFLAELAQSGGISCDHEIVGELRQSARDLPDIDASWLISGVLSSRVCLKQANAKCEDELCLWAEPFSAFAASSLEFSYPFNFLKLAWRHLLENHAHDSICGCSIDQVHKDMEYRFDQSYGISQKVTESSLRAIALAAAPTGLSQNSLTVTLFNPTAEDSEGPLDVQIRLPASWPEKFQEFFGYEEKFAFRIVDSTGQEIPWQLNGQKRDHSGFRRAHRKIPAADTRHIIDVTLSTFLPAFGYTSLTVEPVPGPIRHLGTHRTADRTMENEFLRIEVEANGTVTLTDKASEKSYHGLFFYEDGADIGDGWNWCPPVNDTVTTSAGASWTLSVLTEGPEKTTFEITTCLQVPEAFDFKAMRRSGRKQELLVTNRLTLRRGSRILESEIEVNNTIEDHRLRVWFPTHLQADSYFADSAFDMVERPISLAMDNERRRELDLDGRPQQSWTALSDGNRGFAVVSRGLYESGVGDRPDRPLFLTLLRGFRKAVFCNENPGGQSLGRHVFKVNLVPFSGKVPAKQLFIHGQRISSSIRCVDLLPQEIRESSRAALPRCHGFLQIQGDVVVTSIQANKDNQWTIRLFNPSMELEKFSLGNLGQFKRVDALNLAGEEDTRQQIAVKDGVAVGMLGGKRILTLCLTPAVIPEFVHPALLHSEQAGNPDNAAAIP